MVSRRGFLTGMLALGAAPAIVRAESLMRIWVPPQELHAGWDLSRGEDLTCIMTGEIGRIDRVSFYTSAADHMALVKEMIAYGVLKHG